MSGLSDFLVDFIKGFLNARGGPTPVQPSPSAKKPTPRPPTGSSRIPQFSYAPKAGKTPDPGEVVWVWVPYEDDPSQGKTRPVLLLGKESTGFVSVYFSSVDHDMDENQEAREGRYWVRVGQGSWDKKGRISYARVDRLLRTASSAINERAEVLDESRFDAVVAGVMAHLS